MEKQEQREPKAERAAGKGRPDLEGLPVQESPYLKYKDLEDYKRQGFGTEGHQQPKPGRGPGATDAPTLSGAALSYDAEAKLARPHPHH